MSPQRHSVLVSEQLSMLLKYMAVTAAIPKVEICDDILAAAEQHQDAFLLASGYFYKARLTLLPQPGVNIASV